MPCQLGRPGTLAFSGGKRPENAGGAAQSGNITRRSRVSARAEKSAVDLNVRAAKRALREQLLRDRASMMSSHAGTARLSIRDRYLTAFDPPAGTVVSAFWPMPGELDLRPLLEALHARGCACALPVVVRRDAPLVFRAWEPGVTLVTSRFGIAEPGPERAELRPQHALVPLLAFDDDGFRLGYGGGFYDRTLAGLRADGRGLLAIGVGLESQRWPSLPREPFDERLDWLVTEDAAVRF